MTPFEIEDGSSYNVTLAAVVLRGSRKLLPRDKHVLKGSVIREIVESHGWEAIHDATPVQ
ncbi:hypothetical protein [Roseibium alexandrii]|uniref:hypothetical protein n=1 Tax=Roseibium alexandrii TaxID=388408 RepID=UPI0037510C79